MSESNSGLRRRALAVSSAVVVAAAASFVAGAVVWSWGFFAEAPSTFWAISLLALVAEAPLFARRGGGTRVTLSVCFTFTIFLLWGAAPAIVVQALATSVRALSQRLVLWRAALLTSRLVFALAAAQATAYLVGQPGGEDRSQIPSLSALLSFFLPAAAWFVVSFGMVVLGLAVLRQGGTHSTTTAVREDVLGTAALLLLVPPLLVRQPGWWSALVLVPLLAWNQLSRASAGREETLRRDPRTGLLNRRGLMASFDEITADDAIDPQGGRPFALVLLDVEALQAIGRNLGPDLPEVIIQEGARRLADVFGEDNVGRLAGEGFVVLLLEPDEERAVNEGRRIMRLLTAPVIVDGVPFELDPFAGVVLSPAQGRDFDTLLSRAQLAVARARSRGEPVQVYRPETAAEVRRRRQLVTELHATLGDPRRQGEVAVRYQPQVDIGTGRLAGVEALLRWTHPRWGPIRPDDLVAAIETSAVMHMLTAHVIGRTAAQLATWNSDGLRVRAAVNVSVRDFTDDGFVDMVGATLRAHGLDPRQLTVEVTESAVITDAERVVGAATSLRRLGVGLSLDDFGTGYASLQQLRLLPLTEVKIDRSYVRQMTTSTADRAIVVSVHQFARALGLDFVAEGVEDGQTVAALADLPGVIGQGYYFAKPMTPDDLVRWHTRREARSGQASAAIRPPADRP